jgi:hypothetical protein
MLAGSEQGIWTVSAVDEASPTAPSARSRLGGERAVLRYSLRHVSPCWEGSPASWPSEWEVGSVQRPVRRRRAGWPVAARPGCSVAGQRQADLPLEGVALSRPAGEGAQEELPVSDLASVPAVSMPGQVHCSAWRRRRGAAAVSRAGKSARRSPGRPRAPRQRCVPGDRGEYRGRLPRPRCCFARRIVRSWSSAPRSALACSYPNGYVDGTAACRCFPRVGRPAPPRVTRGLVRAEWAWLRCPPQEMLPVAMAGLPARSRAASASGCRGRSQSARTEPRRSSVARSRCP